MAGREMSGWSWRLRLVLALGVLLSGVGVDAGKIKLTKQNRLATLFSGPSFSGNYFAIEGIFNTCYNVLHEASVESATLEAGTSYCEVWGVWGCGEEGDGKDKPREIFGAIPTLNWDGVGEAKDEVKRDAAENGGVKSVRCYEKKVLEKKD